MNEPDKYTVESNYPCVVTDDCTATVSSKTDGHQTAWYKKQIVKISCAFLVILCLIIAAFVLILLFVKQKQIVVNKETTYVVSGDRRVKEAIYRDSSDSILEYNFRDNEDQVSVLLDLNRYLEILKIVREDSGAGAPSAASACYVSPISALNAKFPKNDSETGTTPANGTDTGNHQSTVMNFKRSRYPIRDTSLLGPKGVALCKDTDTYWSIPMCLPNDNDQLSRGSNEGELNETRGRSVRDLAQRGENRVHSRVKRNYWYMLCRWDWTNCFYFSFSGQGYRTYYRCDILCSWTWI